jgi:hypothetical protein
MSDRLFRSLRRRRAAAKSQPANDNRTLRQQLEASLALDWRGSNGKGDTTHLLRSIS